VKHAAKQLYWLVAQGRVLSDAQCVLFTTEEERRLARQSFFGFGRYREEVVAYGAAGPSGEPEVQIQAFRAKLPAIGERRFLLFLSRIHPKKGCDLLISAFAEVAAEHPYLDLVVAGPDESGWRKKLDVAASSLGIAGRIHWPGMLTGEAKWGAFRAAEAFVLPSHQENFGIVVAEALACGKPVLITNKVNIWREVEAAGAGLVADDDALGITSLLRRFLGMSEAEKATMGAAARRCFELSFDVKAAASSLADVLRRLVGRSRLGEDDVPDAVFRQLP
jgi:glycosyltransferase involved in cell wall biosynthesis